jgi:hypothetical protein
MRMPCVGLLVAMALLALALRIASQDEANDTPAARHRMNPAPWEPGPGRAGGAKEPAERKQLPKAPRFASISPWNDDPQEAPGKPSSDVNWAEQQGERA